MYHFLFAVEKNANKKQISVGGCAIRNSESFMTWRILIEFSSDYNILTGKPRPAVEKFSTRNGSSGSEARRLAGSQTLYQEDKDGDYVNGTCPLDSVHSSLGNLESVGKHLLLPDSVYNDGTFLGEKARRKWSDYLCVLRTGETRKLSEIFYICMRTRGRFIQ